MSSPPSVRRKQPDDFCPFSALKFITCPDTLPLLISDEPLEGRGIHYYERADFGAFLPHFAVLLAAIFPEAVDRIAIDAKRLRKCSLKHLRLIKEIARSKRHFGFENRRMATEVESALGTFHKVIGVGVGDDEDPDDYSGDEEDEKSLDDRRTRRAMMRLICAIRTIAMEDRVFDDTDVRRGCMVPFTW